MMPTVINIQVKLKLCLMSELPKDGVPEKDKVYLEKQGNKLRYIILDSVLKTSVIDGLLDIYVEVLTKEFLVSKQLEILMLIRLSALERSGSRLGKLLPGLRVDSARDDAAGLAIPTRFTSAPTAPPELENIVSLVQPLRMFCLRRTSQDSDLKETQKQQRSTSGSNVFDYVSRRKMVETEVHLIKPLNISVATMVHYFPDLHYRGPYVDSLFKENVTSEFITDHMRGRIVFAFDGKIEDGFTRFGSDLSPAELRQYLLKLPSEVLTLIENALLGTSLEFHPIAAVNIAATI